LENLHKKIYFFEFIPKTNLNSIEYYLNNTLKSKKVQNNQDGSRVNSFVIPQFGNSTINNLNNNTLVNIISQVEDEIPYNISEHFLPLGEEENIIKILKSNDYFQDQTNDAFSLVLNELIYISAFKGMKIYDLNDESNYFFIINKGSVKVIRNNGENHIENNDHGKTLGPWESFGEISFYSGKARNEIMIAKENVELIYNIFT